MKARIHGIEVEGTPAEIAEVIKLVGVGQGQAIQYVPYIPWQPQPSLPSPWWEWVPRTITGGTVTTTA